MTRPTQGWVSTPSARGSRSSTSRPPPSRADTATSSTSPPASPRCWPGSSRAGSRTRLALALDATSLGDRFTVLSIGVVYRGQAIPVAWKVLPANVPHPWKPEWLALLRASRRLGRARLDGARDDRPRPVCPLALPGDRGLGLASRDADHPAEQVPQAAARRRSVPVTALVPRAGCRWQGRGVAFPKKPERRLECTLMACWEEGYEEPWFLVTDLAPDQAEGLWYGMRSWIEGGFKLLKSGGWQWQATRMTDRDGRSGCGWCWRWRRGTCWPWAGRPPSPGGEWEMGRRDLVMLCRRTD